MKKSRPSSQISLAERKSDRTTATFSKTKDKTKIHESGTSSKNSLKDLPTSVTQRLSTKQALEAARTYQDVARARLSNSISSEIQKDGFNQNEQNVKRLRNSASIAAVKDKSVFRKNALPESSIKTMKTETRNRKIESYKKLDKSIHNGSLLDADQIHKQNISNKNFVTSKSEALKEVRNTIESNAVSDSVENLSSSLKKSKKVTFPDLKDDEDNDHSISLSSWSLPNEIKQIISFEDNDEVSIKIPKYDLTKK